MEVAVCYRALPSTPEKMGGAMQRETDPRKPGIGKTVLVVDDNAAIRKMLATAFCPMVLRHASRRKTAKRQST
jgi:hypothetical protein